MPCHREVRNPQVQVSCLEVHHPEEPEQIADSEVAVAVTAGCDYLVSWNYSHMVNAALRARIEGFCRARGPEPAVICTPGETMEV